jgi:uncharacterized protein YcbK (DUF882 family)
MITFKKKENKQLSPHFNSSEFECSCDNCDVQLIDEELISKLEKVRELYGRSIRVNSGYRCADHNAKIGGKIRSSHMSGLAADISPTLLTLDDLDLLYEICYDIFDNIGDGRHKKFIHIDTRSPKVDGKRHWIY